MSRLNHRGLQVLLWGILASGLLPAPHASASQIIWQWDTSHTGGIIGVYDDTFEFALQFSGDPTYVFLEPGMFVNVTWSNDVFGQTFVANADNDPAFARTVEELTNGTLGFFHFGVYEWGIWGALEDTIFTWIEFPEGNGIDLAGYRIDHFTLTVMTPTYVSPGQDPNGNGNWTDFHVPYVLTAYGALVPEPATLLLIVWAPLVGCVLRRWRR